MTIQISEDLRNARLDSVEVAIGVSPTLRVRTGAVPANTSANDAGTVLATVDLPADWMANAAGASKAMSGVWADNAADAAGTAGHWRIYNSAGVCKMQGTITATGGGGDMTLDNVVFNVGQQFQVTQFTWNEPNG